MAASPGRQPLRTLALAVVVLGCGTGGAVAPASSGASAAPSTAAVASAGSMPDAPAGRIAFGRFVDAISDFNLYTMNPDGSDVRGLLYDRHELPRWSPDGSVLSITSLAGDQVVPALIRPDGTGYREIHADPTLSLGCAAWSPDGTTLACEGWDDPGDSRDGVYLLRINDGKLTQLTTGHDVPGSFSPDGTAISYMRMPSRDVEGGPLFVVGTDGSNGRQVGDIDIGLGSSWSPDGKTILVDSGGTLSLVRLDDGSSEPLGVADGAFVARWQPDGSHIVFAMNPPGGDKSDLWTIDADGSGLVQVTDTPDIGEDMPDWSP